MTWESYKRWNDELRALPNALIRSSLFGISGRDNRVLVRKVYANQGVTFHYKGIGYDQYHFDVFAAVAHLARGLSADAEIRTTRYHLLKIMNRSAEGKRNYGLLYERLTDLQVGTLMIESNQEILSRGPLLQKVDIDKATGALRIKLNPDMRPLFDAATHIEWSQRTALKSPLDKWLHAFFASHARVLPMKVDTYRWFCGSSASKVEFKRMLRESLQRLKNKGYIVAFKIDEREHVKIKKKPTKSQQRHLSKKQVELFFAATAEIQRMRSKRSIDERPSDEQQMSRG